MQRHLIAFDLDETLSQSHIFKTIMDQARVHHSEMHSANMRRARWIKASEDPQAELNREVTNKKSLIEANERKIQAHQAMIEGELARKGIDDASASRSDATQREALNSSSDDELNLALLPPAEVIEKCKLLIAEYERANRQLQDELDKIDQNDAAAVENCKKRAEVMIAQMEAMGRLASERYTATVNDLEVQWELIKNIPLMCDQILFQALLAELKRDGHAIAIVTFNDLKPLVNRFLEDKCTLDLKTIAMHCFNSEVSVDKAMPGKNMHLKKVIDLCSPDLSEELKADLKRVILIDDSASNIQHARDGGFSGFHFDIRAMSQLREDVAVNAQNAYLAFLIVKFGYEDKLSEHIERLKLHPMLEQVKLQSQREDLRALAAMTSDSRKALRTAGVLPTAKLPTCSSGSKPPALKK